MLLKNKLTFLQKLSREPNPPDVVQQKTEKKIINYITIINKYKMYIFKTKGYQGMWEYCLGYRPRDQREWRKMNAPPAETKFWLITYPDGTQKIVGARYGRVIMQATINPALQRKIEEGEFV